MTGAVMILAGSGGMTVKLTPATVFGAGVGTVTTNQALVSTVTGGVTPLSYSWSLSGDPGIFSLSPTGSFSFFRRHNVESAETYGATATLTVTDASGAVASANGNVEIIGIS